MKSEQATLLILSPGFPENEADSTCLPSLRSFVKTLKQKFPSFNVIVLALQYPYVGGEYNLNGCRVIALGGKGRSKFFRLLLWRKAWKKMLQLNKENNITGLLSFWYGEAALIGNRFGKRYAIKHYCWILGQDAKKENRYVRRVNAPAKELVAISDFIQREFERNHGTRPQQVIPIGIDVAEFPEKNCQKNIDVLGAGSLIPLKQFAVFVEIIGRIKNKLPDIKAMIAGKGPEEKKLTKLIEREGLLQNCILTGELPHSELLTLMKRSKVFVHTANYEGFGAVCIEALYAGAEVVSFCKPMNRSIPNWHTVQSKEEMVKKVMDILNIPKAFSNEVSPYVVQETVSKMMQLYM
jgi:glycosyltransferase involved in cell wall biosynthesis